MPIALVPAAGNSSDKRYYEYIDKDIHQLNSVVIYYRLGQIDMDGKYAFSRTVPIRHGQPDFDSSLVYSNPTTGNIVIKAGSRSLVGTEAMLTDVNGKILEKFVIDAEYALIDLSKYLKSLYFIRLANKQGLRIVKQ